MKKIYYMGNNDQDIKADKTINTFELAAAHLFKKEKLSKVDGYK